MGFFSPQLIGTSGSSTTQSLPPWVEATWQETVDRAQLLSENPYQPFPGPRMAPLNADQLAAFEQARSGVGAAQPYFQQGVDLIGQGMQAPTMAGIQAYMNPFDELVTQNIISELSRRNDIEGVGEAARAAQLGAFGGSRTGVVEAERGRNFERLVADVMAQRGAESYAQGLGQFNKQQQLQLGGGQALAGLAPTFQQLQAGDTASLLGIGSLQQGQSQQSLQLAYEDFIRQQQYPYTQVSFLSDVLSGVPSSQQVTQSQQQQPGPSIGQQITGIGLGALGILGSTGAFSSGPGGWW